MEVIDNLHGDPICNSIPSGWEIVPIGDVFEFKNGLNKEKSFFGQGTPIVNYMDVYKRNGLYKKHIHGEVTLSTQEIKNYSVKKGDVLFTRTSETVEEIGISSVLLEDIKDCVFSGFVLRGRPKNDMLVDEFKKYCFSSKHIRSEIQSRSTYTTRALTNGRILSQVLLPVPTKYEQSAIATALSDTDALIENLEKLIAKKRNIKQGVMQELLTGKKRLAGFNGEWAKIELGDICDISKGQLITEKTAAGGEFPVIAGGINPSYFHNRPNRGKNTITISASGANAGYVSFHRNPIFASDCSTIEEKGTFNIVYLFFVLQLFQKKIFKLQTGGAQPHVYPEHLKPLELLFPQEVTEQYAIANILIDIDEELSGLEKQMNKYQLIKQGMMQTLLTGKIRLV